MINPKTSIVLMLAVILMASSSFLKAEDSAPPLPLGLEESTPALPAGLEDKKDDAPALPAGLAGSDAPALPAGLGGNTASPESSAPKTDKTYEEEYPVPAFPIDMSGFIEGRIGTRTQEDDYEKETSIAETRLQLTLEKQADKAGVKVTADFLYDDVIENNHVEFEKGRGWVDLREASLMLRPTSFMDIKAGRQVLTWGTGDMLFINDLFPKDWNSFFIGRDDEYLKAPSDALKISLFSSLANLDVVYSPRFDPDRFIDGRRVSYYNATTGQIAGQNAISKPITPHDSFDDDELAVRLYRTFGATEAALYAYNGFWKSPAGMDATTGKATYPKLAVYGGSLRAPIWGGIGNAEFGYYDSKDDSDGSNAFVRNSEFRLLFGYKRELARDFNAAVQYYTEYMIDHGDYQDSLPSSAMESDELRQVITLRLTKQLMQQTMTLGMFAYWSPTDGDSYIRPNIKYKINDRLTVEAGGNVFWGEDEHTFFGQFEQDSNIYFSIRYGF